jgi:aryl-alcohol dehydrogenase-like predicted oxidoreductase
MTTTDIQRRIGPFRVFPIGLGCMGLNFAYGTAPPVEQAERVLLAALDGGVTLFDTAAAYANGENERIVGRVLEPHRQRVVLATKGGITVKETPQGKRNAMDGRPESVRHDVEQSLARLKTDVIDLYYLHRLDKTVPIEDSVGALSRLVEQGKLRALGLSEVSADTLRRAHAVYPIAALQSEYSMWTRNPEIAVLKACRELGTTFVAFSPVGRGFFTDAPPDPTALPLGDTRRTVPRFAPEHRGTNNLLRDRVKAIALREQLTLPQLALAWLLTRAEHVVPIPGTTKVANLQENLKAANHRFSDAVMLEINDIVNPQTVSGNRYSEQSNADVDTESFD